MAKEKNVFVKNIKIAKPDEMDYYVPLSNDKEIHKFICRVEKLVRSSTEYRDYIKFLKEHVGLDSCVFFQSIGGNGTKKSHVSIELHHEPFTLYDIVATVLTKYRDEGLPINDLLISDEVMELHYANKVGLVPLCKTMHQVIHNSTKMLVPLNMVYGQYSEFLEEYEPYIDESLYEKLERKLDMTKNLTPESFEAIKKEFTYLEVDGVDDLEKIDLKSSIIVA